MDAALDLNWGDVPTWVGSVATGVALLIAAFAYRKSVSDGERAQALRVTLWVEEDLGDPSGKTRVLHVKNGSDSAIYSVTAYYQKKAVSWDPSTSPYYMVENDSSGLRKLGKWPSLGPGDKHVIAFTRSKLSEPEIPWLYFRDADGVDWVRDYRARLERHNSWLMRYISESYYLEKRFPLWLWILFWASDQKDSIGRLVKHVSRKGSN